MTSYGSNMSGANNVTKQGKTQPTPRGSEGRNPNQGGGAVPNVGVGKGAGPVVTPAGATQK